MGDDCRISIIKLALLKHASHRIPIFIHLPTVSHVVPPLLSPFPSDGCIKTVLALQSKTLYTRYSWILLYWRLVPLCQVSPRIYTQFGARYPNIILWIRLRSPQKQILSFPSILLSKSHSTALDRYGMFYSLNPTARLFNSPPGLSRSR